jgi:hypothetical protein
MKLSYTEFSFGYAFTENLIRSTKTRPSGAPTFPNLVQEADLGYDVRVECPSCPLFFQYKLPELMVRNSAAEISLFALPGICVPFFRMSLMRRDLSDQHMLLVDLEQQFPHGVYYVAPSFEDMPSFNGAQVHVHSAYFSPRDVGYLPDDKQHTICYGTGLTRAWFCSEPQEIPIYRFEGLDVQIRQTLAEGRFPTLEALAADVRARVLDRVAPEIRAAEGQIRERVRARRAARADRFSADVRIRNVTEELLVSREIARVGLGADMVIAQPRV